MAPEQIEGRQVTVKTDLYSLGLVLYELFTGEQAYKAQSAAELARLQRETMPTSPSTHVEGFDPAVERVILRCLDKEPARRPGSALAIAAALPGGDPLAAALAAGETPSPELVAAAGEKVGLKPWIAWSCLALIAAGLPFAVMLIDRVMLLGSVPMELTPQVLQAKAQEIVTAVGYSDPPADTAYGFVYDDDYLDYLMENPPDEGVAERLADAPAAIRYWYRQSPALIVQEFLLARRVDRTDPPPLVPGMIAVELDPRGRLLELTRVPTDADTMLEGDEVADWASLFSAAGLDFGAFTAVPPSGAPPVYADRLAAWEGSYPAQPDVAIHVEGASLRGRPVDFRVVGSWVESREAGGGGGGIMGFVGFLFVMLILATAFLMARYNVRQGRGDRRGALRLAVAFFAIQMTSWLLEARHVRSFDEIGLFFGAVIQWFAAATLMWVVYLALEPFVRRRWPDLLVSWTRLLDQRFRDPLVGRDLLIGATVAVGLVLLDEVSALAPSWAGGTVAYTRPPLLQLLGGRVVAGGLLGWAATLWPALLSLLLLILFRMLLKRNWAAFLAAWTIFSALSTGTDDGFVALVFVGVFWGLFMLLLMRFGLLAALAALYLHAPLAHGIMTTDLGSWYSDYTIGALLLLVAVALYGFWVSFAGRPLLGEHAFED
jgi:serine/threonine-protein kinase